MKYQKTTRYTLIAMLSLALGACSGSGSGPAPQAGDAANPGSSDASGESVTVTITSPAAGDVMETPDEAVTLAGTASGGQEIVAVAWVNEQTGEQGQASGNSTWETGAIPLELGENTITVTATDSAGVSGERTVVINRDAGYTGSVTLSWEAPTTREDGTPLTNLAGYNIYYGKMSGTYDYHIVIDNPGVTTYVVENLSSGTWYFVMSSFDTDGVESNKSNEITRDVP